MFLDWIVEGEFTFFQELEGEFTFFQELEGEDRGDEFGAGLDQCGCIDSEGCGGGIEDVGCAEAAFPDHLAGLVENDSAYASEFLGVDRGLECFVKSGVHNGDWFEISPGSSTGIWWLREPL
jgi:hypothetical protein